jgi:PAS domain S-box-containing protein
MGTLSESLSRPTITTTKHSRHVQHLLATAPSGRWLRLLFHEALVMDHLATQAFEPQHPERICHQKLFERIDQGMCVIDVIFDDGGRAMDFRFVEVNPAFEIQTGFVDAAGRTARELLPELDQYWFETYGDVVRSGEPVRFDSPVPALNRWYEVYAFPLTPHEDQRVALLFSDISERKLREANATFLDEISLDMALLSDEKTIMNTIARKTANHLGVSQIIFTEVEPEQAGVEVLFTLRDGIADYQHQCYDLCDYLSHDAIKALESGQGIVIEDVRTDPRTLEFAAAYEPLCALSEIKFPYISDGQWRFLVCVLDDKVRRWTEQDMALVRELTERTWLRLERARSDQALRRLTRETDRRTRLYEAVTSTTPDLQYVFDRNCRFTYANEALLRMWGKSWEESIGKSLLELGYEPWHAELHEHEIARVFATKQPVRGEVPFTGTNGRRIYDYILVPVLGDDGQVEAVAGTTRDITEFREKEEALLDADHRKDRFMAVLSHELRNPLAPIRNSLYVLNHCDFDSLESRRAREILGRQVDQLARLVDDLLDATRISQDKIQLQCERLDLNELIASTVDDHRPFFESRSIHLEVSLNEAPLYVQGDRNRLAQVLGNLLHNAAKFTPPHGCTAIALSPVTQGSEARISVVDTGLGMNDETLALAFEPFAQADTSIDHASGGLGIGLSLVKGLIDLHQGRVRAHSQGLGCGSTFEVFLPVDHRLQTAQRSPRTKKPRLSRRVLLIEDNLDVAQSMRMILEHKGHEVEVAHSGSDGLQRARSSKPDVVLCDIGLPETDGYAVARQIRRDPCLQDVYLIALSGYAMPADIEKSHIAGFDRHLAKPPDLEVLDRYLDETPGYPSSRR